MPPKTQPCCAHNHDCESAECGVTYSLYKHIDLTHVRVLNAEDAAAARNVFKPWHERLQPTAVPLRSQEDDPELLIHIP